VIEYLTHLFEPPVLLEIKVIASVVIVPLPSPPLVVCVQFAAAKYGSEFVLKNPAFATEDEEIVIARATSIRSVTVFRICRY
jgi:hypothetical protein